jgi:uncharacterized membrane protein (DUF2068 family)
MTAQRPLTLTLAVGVLTVLSLLSLALPLMAAPGGPPTVVVIGAVVAGALGLLAAVGLWLRRRWAAWLAVIVTALNALGVVPGIVVAPTLLLQIGAITAVVGELLFIVLVLLPSSRCAYD